MRILATFGQMKIMERQVNENWQNNQFYLQNSGVKYTLVWWNVCNLLQTTQFHSYEMSQNKQISNYSATKLSQFIYEYIKKHIKC